MNKNFTILYFEEIISKIIEDLDQSNLLVDIDHKMMYYLCEHTMYNYIGMQIERSTAIPSFFY